MAEIIGGFGVKYAAEDLPSQDFAGGEFEVYRNLAALIRPESFLEIGVYCGYSAVAVLAGAGGFIREYIGVDAEKYRPDSNGCAERNLRAALKSFRSPASARLIRHDTQTDGVPGQIAGRIFEWVHIDAGHATDECLKDMAAFWPMAGRVMTVHDIHSHPEVGEAARRTQDAGGLPDCAGFIDVCSLHGFRLYFRA